MEAIEGKPLGRYPTLIDVAFTDKMLADLRDLYNKKYESPFVKGAYIAAYKKEVKKQLFLRYTQKIKGYDLTFHLVKKLSIKAVGRSFDREFIIDNFATPERTAENKTKDIEKTEEIYNKYFQYFNSDLERINDTFRASRHLNKIFSSINK